MVYKSLLAAYAVSRPFKVEGEECESCWGETFYRIGMREINKRAAMTESERSTPARVTNGS